MFPYHAIHIRWLLALFALFASINTVYAKEEIKYIDLAAPYVIIVASSNKPFSEEDLKGAYVSNGHRYYTVKVKQKSKKQISYQLRYGFFRTKSAAGKMQESLKIRFKKTYITKTRQSERNISSQSEIVPPAHAKLAEYLIVSTAYKTANVLAEIAGSALNKAPEASVKQVERTEQAGEDEAPQEVAEIKYDNYLVISLKTTNNLSDFDKVIKHPEIVNN
ncbi:hypothetical protein MNBD_GAMMA09-1629, partial [hydrothermal vent metagenome]